MGQRVIKNQVWAAFNHLPGGQVGTVHFEDVVRTKKVGDSQQDILFTSREQLESFKKQDNVGLNVGGKVVKHEVLVYDGGDLSDNPDAAIVVTEWAMNKKGLQPIRASSDQRGDSPKTYEYDKRISALEGKVDSIDSKLDKILEAAQAKPERQ